MKTRLLLVRHGQSTWNAARRWQGHADPPLSELGREQARATAATLAVERIDALFTSDLRRAVETAHIVGSHHGLEPVVDVRLRELDIGCWNGLRRDEIEARWPEELAAFDAGDRDAPAGGAESLRDLEVRIHAALDDLAERHRGRRLIVVAHGGVLAAATGEFGHDNAEVARLDWPR